MHAYNSLKLISMCCHCGSAWKKFFSYYCLFILAVEMYDLFVCISLDLRPCGLECAGRFGVPPSLYCTMCMASFHPECAGFSYFAHKAGFCCKVNGLFQYSWFIELEYLSATVVLDRDISTSLIEIANSKNGIY